MEFPHHHHGHRRDDDGDGRRGAPPPAYGSNDAEGYGRPPPQAYGRDEDAYGRPPPSAYGAGGEGYDRNPPPAYGREEEYGRPQPPAYGRDDGERRYGGSEYERPHQAAGGGSGGAPPARRPTVRVFCKADEGYSLAVQNGKVCLTRSDPDDEAQHWIKDMKYSTKVRDEEGYPAFSLINKATGEALKHSLGQSHPVELAPYDPDTLEQSVLWTESRDVGEGFRCIRMVNNIYLNFDAFHGDKDHGGVREGTSLVLWKWCEGDNQRWKIVPWCKCLLFGSSPCSFPSLII